MVLKVGVIGAGASGLCAARHLSMHPDDIEVVVFEKSGSLGGTWVYTDEKGLDEWGFPIHSILYKSLRVNIPLEVMGFLDFPFPVDWPSYAHHTSVQSYLQNYADHFNIKRLIKFHNMVTQTVPLKDCKGWIVTSHNILENKNEVYEFNYLLVCNGHFTVPLVPNIPGIETYTGTFLHSHDYKEPSGYEDKTIVVLGAARSGQEICIELAEKAKHVYLSHNKEPMKAPLPANVSQVSGVVGADNDSLLLKDGTRVQADVLLCCTGFYYSFPFLPEGYITIKEQRVQPLYKHMVHCSNPSLCFIGVPSTIVPFPFFDIQVKFCVNYILGKISLPSQEEMLLAEEEDFQKRRSEGLPTRHAHVMEHRQWEYQDDLASKCEMKTSSKAVRKLFADVWEVKKTNLLTYRETNYKIVDEDHYALR